MEVPALISTGILLGISEALPFFGRSGGLIHFLVSITNKQLVAFHLKLVEIYSNDSLFSDSKESSESYEAYY